MTMYHGTAATLPIGACLQTPTGVSKMDVVSGGVVYIVDDPSLCCRYGTVYVIEVTGSVSYKAQREKQGLKAKKGRYTKGVFVALPENTKIVKEFTNTPPNGGKE